MKTAQHLRHLLTAFRTTLLSLCLLYVVGCAPAKVRFTPGEVPTAVVPTQKETQQGEVIRQHFLNKEPMNFNPRYVHRVAHITSRLLGAAPTSEHWKVYVMDTPEWNARTTPGNFIYVYRGLLDDLRSDDEVAAVLAHEIGHNLAQHHKPNGSKALGNLAVLLAGTAIQIGMEDANAHPKDIEVMTKIGTDVMRGLAVNPYSHVDEHEADQIGLFLMADAGTSRVSSISSNPDLSSTVSSISAKDISFVPSSLSATKE